MPKGDTVHMLVTQMAQAGLPRPELEYVFAPVDERGKPIRRWRFDVAFVPNMLAVEIDGGLFTGRSRHGGAPSVVRDLEKRQAAAALGWRILPVTPTDVRRGRALMVIEAALGTRSVGELL